MADLENKITYQSTNDLLREHGLIVTILYWVTEIASWFSIGHWLRALPRIDSIKFGLDSKTEKILAWWQDLVSLVYLGLTPLSISLAWDQNPNTSCMGALFAAYLLYDPIIYNIRVLWFDDLKPGIPDSRRGVWSHRRILFLAIAAYIQSIVIFPVIYHQVEALQEFSRQELLRRSLSIATSLSLSDPSTSADLFQLAVSLFLLVIVIATTASIAYGRKEFAGKKEN